MGTKRNPGRYDRYAKAEYDEPMFVLLARDPAAPVLVRRWAASHAGLGLVDNAEIDEALACADAMERWANSHRAEVAELDDDDKEDE